MFAAVGRLIVHIMHADLLFIVLGTTVSSATLLPPAYFKPVLLACTMLTNIILVFRMWWEHRQHGELSSAEMMSTLLLWVCGVAMLHFFILFYHMKVANRHVSMSVEEYVRIYGQMPDPSTIVEN